MEEKKKKRTIISDRYSKGIFRPKCLRHLYDRKREDSLTHNSRQAQPANFANMKTVAHSKRNPLSYKSSIN